MKTLALSFAITSVFSTAMLVSTSATSAETETDSVELDTVTVSADFRNTDVQDIPEAVTVIGADQIQARSADHLESVLSYAPNVNFSSGTSRGRFFQIRGIGERSQFTDPVNPSVGLMVDGIDMTGLAGAATLFDVEQVEVLRGPQGTRFGANALAGMINIQGKAATKETEGYVEAKVGNYNSYAMGAAVSGSLADNIQARIAVNTNQSDGYINNTHLDKENTNNIDENIARAKISWQVNANNDLDMTLLYADVDNGYDGFSIDNNRNTFSNEPGQDTQDSNAASLGWVSRFDRFAQLEVAASLSQTKVNYGYDEDWAFGEYDENTGDCLVGLGPCLATQPGAWGYSSTDEYKRDMDRQSLDVRMVSAEDGRIFSATTDWVVGIYGMKRDEELDRNHSDASRNLDSELKLSSAAVYSELSTQFTADTRLIYGVRGEQWANDYQDSNDISSNEEETLWGGKITLESMLDAGQLAYGSIARGYKAGGTNTDPDISEDNRYYDTEFNNTLELGLKSSLLNDTLNTRLAAFYIQRKDQQVKSSYMLLDESNIPVFQDYLSNAAEGRNYGLELESFWLLTESLAWQLSAGYLKTEFVDYRYQTEDGEFDKTGRAQAHAPEYTLATGLEYAINHAFKVTFESEAKDDFYFSDSHDEKSEAYVLLHARIEYQVNSFTAALYGRNLTDQDYAVRGFGFGNDPRDWSANSQQVQLGSPRLVGIEARYTF